MIILTILQVFWFSVALPIHLLQAAALPRAHILLNIPLIQSLLLLTLDIWAHIFGLLSRITSESLKLALLITKTFLVLITLASSIYPVTPAYVRYIPTFLRMERDITACWFTVLMTMHYIGLSSDGEVWRVMRYLRRNYYGVLIDCAVACWGVMWAVGTFAEWAKVVLYVAFVIPDVYQLDWVGDREGRLEQRERFEVWEWFVRVIQDWRVLVDQAVSGGDGQNLRGAGADTLTE